MPEAQSALLLQVAAVVEAGGECVAPCPLLLLEQAETRRATERHPKAMFEKCILSAPDAIFAQPRNRSTCALFFDVMSFARAKGVDREIHPS